MSSAVNTKYLKYAKVCKTCARQTLSLFSSGNLAIITILVASGLFTDSLQLASFLAASSPHSGDWLQAMPISSCGLRLDDEAVRIGVGLRLGLTLCVPHKCHCGALVDLTSTSVM